MSKRLSAGFLKERKTRFLNTNVSECSTQKDMVPLSVFATLVAFCQIITVAETQTCHATGSEESILGWMLQKHIYRTMRANIGIPCALVCREDVRCQSLNFVMSLRMCEFSNRTKEARPEDFVPDPDRYYFRRDINRVALGSIPELAAVSCQEIKASEGQVISAKYWLSTIKPDVDECTASSPVCDLNAFCNNSIGSYNCTCKPGYFGDGKTCKDVDECTAASLSICHANASCTNTLGSYNCTCKPGYIGDGKTCRRAYGALFTTLGASGRLGPTSLGSYYRGKDHEGQVAVVSGIQRWTVPYTGDYRIDARGAAGGYDTRNNSQQYRGRGARMIGTFSLIKGETIQILVGQEGGINYHSSTSGGGGGTFVVRGTNTPLIVAGGGGGVETVTSRHLECDANTATTGKTGFQSLSGGSGGQGAQASDKSAMGGGGGGFYSSGRSSPNFNGTSGYGGEGGRGFLQGGVGGRALHYNAIGGFGGGAGAYGHGGGGGGGGGYSGGGSGKARGNSCGGGGGSYNAGKNRHNQSGYNLGHGQVTITFT
ncbi:uncharacterized protein [Montipora foliosa]|uniref:uncharacterized protein isoform X2 n=1 Tax=Montipora foliosa TaxID=591990 RepID=UPI0035F16277